MRLSRFAPFTLFVLWAFLSFFPMRAQAQLRPRQSGTNLMTPFQRLDQKARLENPSDKNSVDALTDEVFNSPSQLPHMPPEMESLVKGRLSRAEIVYLRGGPGVREDDIVRLVNILAEKFNLPDYARTSQRQVRFMRMALARLCPSFMAKGMIHDGMAIGEPVSTRMSPLQAVYLLREVIGHKFWDADFQLTPSDWEKDRYQKSLGVWQRSRKLVQSAQLNKATPVARVTVTENPKRLEISETLAQNMSSVTLSEALSLLDQAFTTLQIEY